MKNFIIVLMCCVLAGCATPYVKGEKFGYSDFRVTDNTFTVSFKGNAKCSLERINKFVLRRASEITLKNGFTHFIILEKTNNTKQGFINTSSGSATAYGYGSTATAYGSGYGYAAPISFPSILLKIKCFKGVPSEEYPEVISAEQFLNYNFPDWKTEK